MWQPCDGHVTIMWDNVMVWDNHVATMWWSCENRDNHVMVMWCSCDNCDDKKLVAHETFYCMYFTFKIGRDRGRALLLSPETTILEHPHRMCVCLHFNSIWSPSPAAKGGTCAGTTTCRGFEWTPWCLGEKKRRGGGVMGSRIHDKASSFMVGLIKQWLLCTEISRWLSYQNHTQYMKIQQTLQGRTQHQ